MPIRVRSGSSWVDRVVRPRGFSAPGVVRLRTASGWTIVSALVRLTGQAVESFVFSPSDAGASVTLGSNGELSTAVTGPQAPLVSPTDWLVPRSAALAALYEVRATLNSGALSFGAVGSWLPLSSSRSWGVNQSGPGLREAAITLEIRRTGTTTVLASAVFTLTATVDNLV